MKRTSRNPKARASRRTRVPAFDIVLTYETGTKWWVARAPFLEGAVGQGRTRAAARSNIISAVKDLLDTYAMLGIPAPITRRVAVERAGHAA